jgi:hypothetical protein
MAGLFSNFINRFEGPTVASTLRLSPKKSWFTRKIFTALWSWRQGKRAASGLEAARVVHERINSPS